jgi:hypothetical protein
MNHSDGREASKKGLIKVSIEFDYGLFYPETPQAYLRRFLNYSAPFERCFPNKNPLSRLSIAL